MSIQDYLHEKAEESRHNEVIAFMMFIAGSVFFVGGILASLSFGTQLNWFLFIPYLANFTEAMFLELTFLLVGIFLITVGIGVGLYYYRGRSWYMRELGRANNSENLMRTQQQQYQSLYTAPKARTAPKRKKSLSLKKKA
jgi:hypothetical protein